MVLFNRVHVSLELIDTLIVGAIDVYRGFRRQAGRGCLRPFRRGVRIARIDLWHVGLLRYPIQTCKSSIRASRVYEALKPAKYAPSSRGRYIEWLRIYAKVFASAGRRASGKAT